jgi:hypothetical protein
MDDRENPRDRDSGIFGLLLCQLVVLDILLLERIIMARWRNIRTFFTSAPLRSSMANYFPILLLAHSVLRHGSRRDLGWIHFQFRLSRQVFSITLCSFV